MRTYPVPALLAAALLLAGCSEGSPDAPMDEDFEDLGLQATKTTGVLRGVVVDAAVRPIAGVAIELAGPSQATATTTDDGLFGFDGLAPGTYFLTASKAGHAPTQQSAEVVAGVADPPIVKVLLEVDPMALPYVVTHSFDGFIECSLSLLAVGFSACSVGPVGDALNDRFAVAYPVEEVPDWIQTETHWESTQAVSPGLTMLYSMLGPDALLANWAETLGPSPLLLQANHTRAGEVGVGSTLPCPTEAGDGCLYIRFFNAPMEGTDPGCIERPVLGGCTTGLGATVEQSFNVLTNLFFGFRPAEGWLYAVDGPSPVPSPA